MAVMITTALPTWLTVLRVLFALGALFFGVLTAIAVRDYQTCNPSADDWFAFCDLGRFFAILFGGAAVSLALAAVFIRRWYLFIGLGVLFWVGATVIAG